MPRVREEEAYENDPRPIVDLDLEADADKAGLVHGRKGTSETEFMEGYGTTDFGVSSYEAKSKFTPKNILLATGLTATGFIVKYRKELAEQFGTLTNYVLLVRESIRSR